MSFSLGENPLILFDSREHSCMAFSIVTDFVELQRATALAPAQRARHLEFPESRWPPRVRFMRRSSEASEEPYGHGASQHSDRGLLHCGAIRSANTDWAPHL